MPRTAGKRGMVKGEPLAMGTLGTYVRGALPAPPRSFDYSTRVADYPMALNDQLGDCTIAGIIHLLQLAYAEVEETFEYPGDDVVRETYLALTQGQDNGLVENAVLDTWMRQGMFSTKIAAYAPVDISNQKEMTAAIYAFGGLYLGIEMPQEAEAQFEANQPWQITPESGEPVGGHCVVATGCNRFGMDIITWGATESMTWEWWKRYGHEAWAVIPEVFVEANHGPLYNVDIVSLRQDLDNL